MLRSKTYGWLVAIVMASLACSMSGLSEPASNGPLDSNSLATIVVGTANAAAAQTAQVDLLTSVPSGASAKAAGPATPTPIPLNMSAEGTALVKQGDGSYIFTDQQAGYSIVIPSVWLALRIDEQDFSNARLSLANADPLIQGALSNFQNSDPNAYRLVGFDTSPDSLKTGCVSNLLFVWDRNDKATLEQDIAEAAKGPPQSSSPTKVTYAGMGATSSHLPMGIIETSKEETTTSKQILNLYQKMILFKLRTGSLTIILTTEVQLKGKFLPGFDLMTDRIKLLP